MRSHRFPRGLWIFLFALCAAASTIIIWNFTHILYPTPETESAFLQHYSPERVISSFKSNQSSASSHHYGSSAGGRKYVTHNSGFESFFVMPPEKWMPLMDALKEDASKQLIGNGAQILAEGGDPKNGFRFDYKAGHVIGSVTILPLIIATPSSMRRAGPLPQGLVDVTARIDQTEMWFPRSPSTTQIILTDSLH